MLKSTNRIFRQQINRQILKVRSNGGFQTFKGHDTRFMKNANTDKILNGNEMLCQRNVPDYRN